MFLAFLLCMMLGAYLHFTDDRSDVLAVGTAGALIDRAVWEEVGGIAPWLGPFGDGLELSRAARLAGYRVIVEPTAVIRHRRASYQGLRRPASVSHSSSAQPRTDAEAIEVALPESDPERSFRARRSAQLTNWAAFSTRPIGLLLTDVGLPGGMNGRQMAEAARASRPGLKVLFITGFAENAAIGHGHLDPGMEIMTKPFEITSLAEKVKQLVDG